MGYGVDTGRYPLKKWGKVLSFHVTGNGNRTNFDKARKAWSNALGTKLLFSEVVQDGVAEVIVEIYDVRFIEGTSSWSSPDGMNGRDPNRGGTLHLKDDSEVGTAIHEIGHMLGLCHEQDRQGDAQARRIRGTYAFGDDVAKKKWGSYKNYGNFDADSIMLYGSGYQTKTAPSPGDVQTVLAINGL